MAESLTNTLERLSRLLHNDAHALALKPVQWAALRYLARANRFSRTPGALTAYLGTTKGTVSQTLLALERKGLISKARHEADKRLVVICLTDAGREVLAADPLSQVADAAERLPLQQHHNLEEGLQNLLRELLDSRGGRAFGICNTCRHFREQDAGGYRCALLDVTLTTSDSEKICLEQEAA